MSVPGQVKPIEWARDLYALVELGEGPPGRLAVCAAHRGAHHYYLEGCFSLPPHAPRHRYPAPEPDPSVRVDEDRLRVIVENAVADALAADGRERRRRRPPGEGDAH